MVEEQNLTLAHPAVQAVKARWDNGKKYCRGKTKHNLTFEDFFELFKANRHSMNTIGQQAGIGRIITRERVRQIYKRYFRELFEGQSGRERLSARTLKKRLAIVKDSEKRLFEDPFIKVIVESARNAGCKVEAGRRKYMEKIRKFPGLVVNPLTLLINGYKCSVHNPTVATTRGKRLYGQSLMSYSVLHDTDVIIVYINITGFPERTFVIPSSLLLKLYFIPLESKLKTLYIPLEQLPVYNNRRPRFDIWQYENAWHLLQPKT